MKPSRSPIASVVFIFALVAVAIALRHPLVAWFTGEPRAALADAGGAPAASASSGAVDHYTCSMHPSVKSKTPGKCPICGMDLVPVTKEQQEQGVVMIDGLRRQLIGVRTSAVAVAPMNAGLRAIGHVTYDEAALTDVNLKVRGWITKLSVNQSGQRVARGQTLFTMYSPELYAAEKDFLVATQGASAGFADAGRMDSLASASRQRLKLLGLGDAQIDEVAKSGKPHESVSVPSPASGVVIEKNVVEGASIDPGMRLYRIAALTKVWVEADVYEADLSRVRVGQPARVTLDSPDQAHDARVAYVYPAVDSKARTGRVRIELANTELELKPGMYANVELLTDLGPRLQVPIGAVVYTGPRRLVFVDLGDGRFRPQEITIGSEAGGMYEVLSGLREGDVVATSGVYLIAAEARISTAASYWDSADAGVLGERVIAPPSATFTPAPASSAPRPASTTSFSCPMHPEIHRASPGKCPVCGMDLVPEAPKR